MRKLMIFAIGAFILIATFVSLHMVMSHWFELPHGPFHGASNMIPVMPNKPPGHL